MNRQGNQPWTSLRAIISTQTTVAQQRGAFAMTRKQACCSVLQVAYYPSLLQTRQAMMEADGHAVTSVLGNDQCIALATARELDFDVVLVGFSGKIEQRREIIRWLKQFRPKTPVVALRTQSEDLPDADHAISSEEPQAWLSAVRNSAER